MPRPICAAAIAVCAAVLTLILPASGPACEKCLRQQHQRCHTCGQLCCPARLVVKTVRVPTPVVETRIKSVLIEEMQDREETYTAFKRVPKQQKFLKERCYLEDVVKSQVLTQKNCKLVMNPGIREFKVNVYGAEEYGAEGRCPSDGEGCPASRDCSAHGAPSAGCPSQACGCAPQPCQCGGLRMHQEFRADNIERPQLVFEEVTKEIFYCAKEPKKHTELCAEETVYELVPVEQKRTVQVCVPRFEKVACEVTVMKCLPQEVLCCEACCRAHGHSRRR